MLARYIIACLCLLVAIGCEMAAKRCYAHAAIITAEATSQKQAESAAVRQQASSAAAQGNWFSLAGLGAVLLGIAFWILSARQGWREERRLSPVLPLALAIAYIMLMLGVNF